MKNYVLDSYAILTYFQNEAGAEKVEKLLADAETGDVRLFLSAVNLGETAYITQWTGCLEGPGYCARPGFFLIKIFLTVAISFAVMQRHGIEAAFTFDRHFKQYGLAVVGRPG